MTASDATNPSKIAFQVAKALGKPYFLPTEGENSPDSGPP